jgi:predicted nucleic acid-binding protein
LRTVVDASVAIKWILPEAGSDAAAALQGDELLAPAWWLAEAANALWKRAARGVITAAEAARLLSKLRNAPVAAIPVEPDVDAALALAIELRHPIYDCIYLALAIREKAVLVTADSRFFRAAGHSSRYREFIRFLDH